MNKYAFILMILICLINSFLLAGCGSKHSSSGFVDVNTLGKMIDKKKNSQKQQEEEATKMFTLKNGVIIYKDKTTITPDDDFVNSHKLEFGPKKLNIE